MRAPNGRPTDGSLTARISVTHPASGRCAPFVNHHVIFDCILFLPGTQDREDVYLHMCRMPECVPFARGTCSVTTTPLPTAGVARAAILS